MQLKCIPVTINDDMGPPKPLRMNHICDSTWMYD